MHFAARRIVALLFAFVLSSSSQDICRYDKEQISLCQEVMSPIPWQRAVPIFLPNDSVPSERAASLQNFARHACFLTPACMSAAIKVRLVLFCLLFFTPLCVLDVLYVNLSAMCERWWYSTTAIMSRTLRGLQFLLQRIHRSWSTRENGLWSPWSIPHSTALYDEQLVLLALSRGRNIFSRRARQCLSRKRDIT